VPIAYNPTSSDESDPTEVNKAMNQETSHDAHYEALYGLVAGAEGCASGARSAELAQDDELADFLLRVHEEVAEEAKRLLAQRVAE
jgi:hypothetical protein